MIRTGWANGLVCLRHPSRPDASPPRNPLVHIRYVNNFDKFTRNDPWYDVEVYMNWEPNSWNDRKWVVAQGDGLFKHSDRAKWG